jgi:hypothetical protein
MRCARFTVVVHAGSVKEMFFDSGVQGTFDTYCDARDLLQDLYESCGAHPSVDTCFAIYGDGYLLRLEQRFAHP